MSVKSYSLVIEKDRALMRFVLREISDHYTRDFTASVDGNIIYLNLDGKGMTMDLDLWDAFVAKIDKVRKK